ncbi:MAG: recombinase family protein [Bacillota bacterium]
MKKIQIIEQSMDRQKKRKKVCAYYRTSTKSTKQHHSFLAQKEYYEKYIEANPDWECVGLYSDESSGTKLKNRDGFLEMIDDCRKGKIDYIITKSITRFARNTVDAISIIRELKLLGIGIYFEKENLDTLGEQSEMMLTILSSVAQCEAESTSTNVRWNVQKGMKDGSRRPSEVAYGYEKDVDGELVINHEIAPIIRKIYESYLDGKGARLIAQMINAEGIPTIRGGTKWSVGIVSGILKNPIYKGEMRWQKTFTTDTLPYTRKINYGEKQMYSIQGNHEGIVTEREFELVQEIFLHRQKQTKARAGRSETVRYPFSGKIICKDCGSTHRRQKISIGTESERVQWVCKTYIESSQLCKAKAVREEVLNEQYQEVWDRLRSGVDEILAPLLASLQLMNDCNVHTEEIKALKNLIVEQKEQGQRLVRERQLGCIDTVLFISKENEIEQKIEMYQRKLLMLQRDGIYDMEIVETKKLMKLLKEDGDKMEVLERVDVTENELVFVMKNGLELRAERK